MRKMIDRQFVARKRRLRLHQNAEPLQADEIGADHRRHDAAEQGRNHSDSPADLNEGGDLEDRDDDKENEKDQADAHRFTRPSLHATPADPSDSTSADPSAPTPRARLRFAPPRIRSRRKGATVDRLF